CSLFIFLIPTPYTVISTLSLHDALPILLLPMVVEFLLQRLHSYTNSSLSIFLELRVDSSVNLQAIRIKVVWFARLLQMLATPGRSEEHTSELQSRENLVCRLLLEKKNNI